MSSGNRNDSKYLLGDDASFMPARLASPPFFKFSTCFFTRPRRFSYFDVSMDAARLRTDFPIEKSKNKVIIRSRRSNSCNLLSATHHSIRSKFDKRKPFALFAFAFIDAKVVNVAEVKIYDHQRWIKVKLIVIIYDEN